MKKLICLLLGTVMILMYTSSLAEEGLWYCPKCGTQMDESYRFCYYDGTPRPQSGFSNSSSSWPTRTFSGVSTKLTSLPSEKDRHQSHSGPNKSYVEVGAYKPYKVSSAKALFRENNYVFVDLIYPSVGHRCLYFNTWMVTNSSVEEIHLTGISATTTNSITPRYGPGYDYDSFDKAYIGSGTRVSVFFETNGWVFAEFQCGLGVVREWLPADQVRQN